MNIHSSLQTACTRLAAGRLSRAVTCIVHAVDTQWASPAPARPSGFFRLFCDEQQISYKAECCNDHIASSDSAQVAATVTRLKATEPSFCDETDRPA
jgi:hypothetical protein